MRLADYYERGKRRRRHEFTCDSKKLGRKLLGTEADKYFASTEDSNKDRATRQRAHIGEIKTSHSGYEEVALRESRMG